MPIMFLASSGVGKRTNSSRFGRTVVLLVMCVVVSFFINDMLIFYIFFEGSLIPTAILILG
jgi:NADH:ubiquinone oxidoreductase subunit 4 (subunit M)